MSSHKEIKKLNSLKVGDKVLYHDMMGYTRTSGIEKIEQGEYPYKLENVDEWYKESELKKISK